METLPEAAEDPEQEQEQERMQYTTITGPDLGVVVAQVNSQAAKNWKLTGPIQFDVEVSPSGLMTRYYLATLEKVQGN